MAQPLAKHGFDVTAPCSLYNAPLGALYTVMRSQGQKHDHPNGMHAQMRMLMTPPTGLRRSRTTRRTSQSGSRVARLANRGPRRSGTGGGGHRGDRWHRGDRGRCIRRGPRTVLDFERHRTRGHAGGKASCARLDCGDNLSLDRLRHLLPVGAGGVGASHRKGEGALFWGESCEGRAEGGRPKISISSNGEIRTAQGRRGSPGRDALDVVGRTFASYAPVGTQASARRRRKRAKRRRWRRAPSK